MINPLPCVLQTLAYHHVFKFPLTPFEIYKYSQIELDPRSTQEPHIQGNAAMVRNGNLWGLSEWNQLEIEQKRERSWRRISYTQRWLSSLIRYIPTIEFVGITGSTAALNATANSDIDILVIAKDRTGWFTRFILLTMLSVLGKRTHTNKNNYHHTFCANLIIESSHLIFEKQDLFTAMEIAHMKPILNKNNSYQKLLLANNWIQNYLPNFWKMATYEWRLTLEQSTKYSQTAPLLVGLNTGTQLVQQLMYQLKNKTPLTLSHTWVIDHRLVILESYEKILKGLQKK